MRLGLFFSRRNDAAKADKPDVFTYETLPTKLRVQITHIWKDVWGRPDDQNHDSPHEDLWKYLGDQMAREVGQFRISESTHFRAYGQFVAWFMEAPHRDAINAVEHIFRSAVRYATNMNSDRVPKVRAAVSVEDAIQELNARFLDNAVGYQFEGEQLIQMDDTFVHEEIVRPALALLAAPIFKTANEDFLTAHKHYRQPGHEKDAIVAANRAFEATMKAIAKQKSWTLPTGGRASDLVKALRAKGLFPDNLDATFDSYVAMLKSGLPEVRNTSGGHGGEPDEPKVPRYIAAYALHMTAANIVMLASAAKK